MGLAAAEGKFKDGKTHLTLPAWAFRIFGEYRRARANELSDTQYQYCKDYCWKIDKLVIRFPMTGDPRCELSDWVEETADEYGVTVGLGASRGHGKYVNDASYNKARNKRADYSRAAIHHFDWFAVQTTTAWEATGWVDPSFVRSDGWMWLANDELCGQWQIHFPKPKTVGPHDIWNPNTGEMTSWGKEMNERTKRILQKSKNKKGLLEE